MVIIPSRSSLVTTALVENGGFLGPLISIGTLTRLMMVKKAKVYAHSRIANLNTCGGEER